VAGAVLTGIAARCGRYLPDYLGQDFPDQEPELVGAQRPESVVHDAHSGSPSRAATASAACRTSSSLPDKYTRPVAPIMR